MQKLAKALVAFRKDCPTIKFDSVNPHFRSKFASLAAIHKAIDEGLAANGLAVLQFPIGDGANAAGCKTVVMHDSGEFVESEFLVPLSKRDPQAACAAVSYARRYGISGALGLVTEDDDDGNAASGSPMPARAKSSPKKGTKAPMSVPSKKKLAFAAGERLKELGMEPDDDSKADVCREIMKKFGHDSSLDALESEFGDMLSAVQVWDPSGEAAA